MFSLILVWDYILYTLELHYELKSSTLGFAMQDQKLYIYLMSCEIRYCASYLLWIYKILYQILHEGAHGNHNSV